MRFAFSEDQRLFQQTLAELLANECGHETLAAAWETADGFVPGLWEKLAEMGIPGLTVPEAHDGLGLGEIDWVLLLEEVGRRANYYERPREDALVLRADLDVPSDHREGDAPQ